MNRPEPTGVRTSVQPDDLLVSKTDPRGVITYANRTFIEICGYPESELIGRPHSLVRHPQMPRCVFHLLWEELQLGREVFAFVVNLCKGGEHYWVFAHVTPDIDNHTGRVVGYHSSRRFLADEVIQEIEPLYAELCEVEAQQRSLRDACLAGRAHLTEVLEGAGVSYEQFVFSLVHPRNRLAA